MFKRILAIGFILGCTSVAWFILGATLDTRTYHSDDKLRSGVASVWGAPQQQAPPTATYEVISEKKIETETDGHKTARTETERHTVAVPAESTRIQVAFDLGHRQKGLLWYSTYWVNLAATYGFRNPTTAPQTIVFRLPFPAEHAIYDGLEMVVNGRPSPIVPDAKGASVTALVPPGETVSLRVAYRSRGLESWIYRLGDEVTQTRDFELRVKTNFPQIDFPVNTLSPTEKRETGAGWELVWRYSNLISGFQIGLTMPQKVQPGPLAGEISYFAPVSLTS